MRYLEIKEGFKPSLTRDIRSAINKVTGDDGAYKSVWNDPIKNGRKVKVEVSLGFVKQVNKKNSKVADKLKSELKKMGHDVREIGYMSAGFRSGPSVIFKINLPVTENASMGATSSGAIATVIPATKKVEEDDETKSKTAWPTRKGKWANSFKGGFDFQRDAERHYALQTKKNKAHKVPVADLAPLENTILRR